MQVYATQKALADTGAVDPCKRIDKFLLKADTFHEEKVLTRLVQMILHDEVKFTFRGVDGQKVTFTLEKVRITGNSLDANNL